MSGSAAAQPADLNANVAVLLERSETQGRKLDEMSNDIRSISTIYATKREMDDVRADVKGIKSGIGWAVKTVLGFVIVAVLAVVIAKGGVAVHP